MACLGSALTGQVGAARILFGMGRDNALPKFFARLNRRNNPVLNIWLIGVLALLGALALNYEKAATLINFGAFLAFMGVNLAVIREFFFRPPAGHVRNWLLDLADAGGGLWFLPLDLGSASPRWRKSVGGIWCLLGLVYTADQDPRLPHAARDAGFERLALYTLYRFNVAQTPHHHLPRMAAYALTIFTGAFLLFQVQPLIGKYILPWFGGGPGVWTTCMLFFQVLLLGGYAYAHFTSRWLKPRTQAILHLVLLAAALALLPITPGDSWKPHGGGNPTCKSSRCWRSVSGCPISCCRPPARFSSNGSAAPDRARSPYRLYALSNVGSLLALVSYPFFFETHFTRKAQAGLWAWGLVAYVLCCGFCAIRLWKSEGAKEVRRPKSEGRRKAEVRSPKPKTGAKLKSEGRDESAEVGMQTRDCGLLIVDTKAEPPVPVGTSDLGLPPPFGFRPSDLSTLAPAARLRLRAAAGDDQQAVPGRGGDSVPLGGAAGALPVELHHLLRQPALVCALSVHAGAHRRAGWLVLGAVRTGATWPLSKQVAIYCGGLFICCMVCHGELYRLKPDPQPSHRVLPDDRRGGRAGRRVRRRRRATALHGLL